MNIKDPQLRSFFQTYNSMMVSDEEMSDDSFLSLLSAIADYPQLRSADATARLASMNREEKFHFVKEHLSQTELADLASLLENTDLMWSPGARNFLEALVGRMELGEDRGPLVIITHEDGRFSGIGRPGEAVEAINVSTAAERGQHLEDMKKIATVDSFGRFTGRLDDVQEGDLVHFRARDKDGWGSDWIKLQVEGVSEQDTRNAELNVSRIYFDNQGQGNFLLKHNTLGPISEPGAKIKLTNAETGEAVILEMDDVGAILHEPILFRGSPGQKITFSVSDGVHNTDFSEVAVEMNIPDGEAHPVELEDPDPRKTDKRPDGTPRGKLERFSGDLVVDGISVEDVKQGSIANCYFAASLGAIAHAQPELLEKIIEKNGDGTYTFRFYRDAYSYERDEVTVDTDLHVRRFGGVLYGKSNNTPSTKEEMELWFPLLEKAYALFRGGYDVIGEGGGVAGVMGAITGGDTESFLLSDNHPDDIFDEIKEAAENRLPMAAPTFDRSHSSLYRGTRITAWHVYTVMGAEEDSSGKKFIQLRNPWGHSEPGSDGKNDGIFKLPLVDFMKLYETVEINRLG